MKTLTALAATGVAVLALTGCAPAQAAAPPVQQSADPVNIYEAVWRDWDGTDRPDEGWITNAATVVCKQIIGGIEPRVVMDNPENNEVVVAAAEQFVCEVDR